MASPSILSSAPPFGFALETQQQWVPLQFAPLPPKPSVSGKRHRSLADIDGAEPTSPQTKKRRLRLDLLPSRLSRSRAYSFPGSAAGAAMAAPRGAPPLTAPLATRLVLERRMGRAVLRKAAIVNWMRVRHSVGAAPGQVLGEIPPELLVQGNDVLVVPGVGGEADIEWTVRAQYLDVPETESPPSPPPGLSNYAALELDENVFDEGNWSDAEAMGSDVDMEHQRGRRGHRRRGALVRGEVEMVPPEVMATGMAGWKSSGADSPYWGMLVEDEAAVNEMRPQLLRREALY